VKLIFSPEGKFSREKFAIFADDGKQQELIVTSDQK
jgi:hypothetical protein